MTFDVSLDFWEPCSASLQRRKVWTYIPVDQCRESYMTDSWLMVQNTSFSWSSQMHSSVEEANAPSLCFEKFWWLKRNRQKTSGDNVTNQCQIESKTSHALITILSVTQVCTDYLNALSHICFRTILWNRANIFPIL